MPDDRDAPTSPYGPQRGRVDEAAGGADSSPFETAPSGEKADMADRPQEQGTPPPADQGRASGR